MILRKSSAFTLIELMLLFLQFLAMVVVNSTQVTIRVVRNYQISTELKSATDNVINYVLKNQDFFDNYSSYLNKDNEFEISLASVVTSTISANIVSFQCLDTGAVDSGKSCSRSNKYWQLVVQVKDLASQNTMGVVQGIRLGESSQNSTDISTAISAKIYLQRVWWYEL